MTSRRVLMAALCALALSATPVWAQTQTQTLTVSAAASLTNVLKTLGGRYEASRPGIKLQFNFAASGVLIQQIAQGAPVDMLISADEETLAKGIAGKLLDSASRIDIASNQVVLVVPATGAVALTGLSGLPAEAVKRVALGKPATVPVGRYTQQLLETAGLWATLKPKFVYADSARQVLDYVARGEVEAGFVYATDAAVMPDKVKVVARVEGHSPVRYPAALVADSKNKPAATEWLAFLRSPAAQSELAKAGFGKP